MHISLFSIHHSLSNLIYVHPPFSPLPEYIELYKGLSIGMAMALAKKKRHGNESPSRFYTRRMGVRGIFSRSSQFQPEYF
jgi:hypothetical protein